MTGFIQKSLINILLASLLFSSCHYKRNKAKPDIWTNLELTTNTPIRNMYAGPTELLIITDDEYVRIGNQNQLLERRLFPDLPSHFFGRPSLSRYAFIWVVTQDGVDQMEVHLTKDTDSSETVYFDLNKFADDNDSIVIKAEETARYNGAFNEDGDQFLLPMLNSSNSIYSLFLFDIKLNLSKDKFVDGGVVLNKRIDLPLDDVSGDIMNTSYVNGFYYITSKWGTYRIDPNTGDYLEINQTWTLDVFGFENKVYMTGFNDFDFYVSEDNGLSFEQVAVSPLKYVEIENDQVLSQTQLGRPWNLADDDMLGIQELRVNKDFEDDGASYWNIKYFYGRYYLSIQKEVYFLNELETE